MIEKSTNFQKQRSLKPKITVPVKKLKVDKLGKALVLGLSSPILIIVLIISLFFFPVIIGGAIAIVILENFLRGLTIKFGWIQAQINDYMLEGNCPYCNNSLSVNLPSEKTSCGFCKERVLVKGEKFYTIIRTHYEEN